MVEETMLTGNLVAECLESIQDAIVCLLFRDPAARISDAKRGEAETYSRDAAWRAGT